MPGTGQTRYGYKSFPKCEVIFVSETTLTQTFNKKLGLAWWYRTNMHTQEVKVGGLLQVEVKAGLHREFKA